MKKHKLTYKKVLKTGLLANLTGLTENEFEKFSKSFAKEHNEYTKKYTFEGEPRTRKPMRRRNGSTFSSTKNMLLFVLMYLRNYQTQVLIGLQFGLEQAQVSKWMSFLSNILLNTLNVSDCLPTRCVDELKKLLEGHQKVFQDATEREIQRPGESEAQRSFYSGKKNDIPLKITSSQQATAR